MLFIIPRITPRIIPGISLCYQNERFLLCDRVAELHPEIASLNAQESLSLSSET